MLVRECSTENGLIPSIFIPTYVALCQLLLFGILHYVSNFGLPRNSFKCAMSFKNITNEIKILDIIPDIINQPGVELTEEITDELKNRSINFEAFDIADVCGNKITARKRSNARCYAFVS